MTMKGGHTCFEVSCLAHNPRVYISPGTSLGGLWLVMWLMHVADFQMSGNKPEETQYRARSSFAILCIHYM